MTQGRLLDIAVCEFGAKGLEGASTRGIAAAAGTAMSAITYHYGGKDGLYLAAAGHVADQMARDMASALCAERGVPDDDPAGARAAIQRIVARFVAVMATDASAEKAMFVLREQLVPTPAFERIYAGLMGQLLDRLTALIRTAVGRRDREAAQIATLTIIAQALAIRSARAGMLRLLEREALDPATIQAVATRIATNIDAILDAMIAERQDLP